MVCCGWDHVAQVVHSDVALQSNPPNSPDTAPCASMPGPGNHLTSTFQNAVLAQMGKPVRRSESIQLFSIPPYSMYMLCFPNVLPSICKRCISNHRREVLKVRVSLGSGQVRGAHVNPSPRFLHVSSFDIPSMPSITVKAVYILIHTWGSTPTKARKATAGAGYVRQFDFMPSITARSMFLRPLARGIPPNAREVRFNPISSRPPRSKKSSSSSTGERVSRSSYPSTQGARGARRSSVAARSLCLLPLARGVQPGC